jgi:hypothetical protein
MTLVTTDDETTPPSTDNGAAPAGRRIVRAGSRLFIDVEADLASGGTFKVVPPAD